MESVTVTAPLAGDGSGHMSSPLQVPIKGRARQGLKKLTQGLQEQGAKLEDGGVVQSSPQAVRWILEQLDASQGEGE